MSLAHSLIGVTPAERLAVSVCIWWELVLVGGVVDTCVSCLWCSPFLSHRAPARAFFNLSDVYTRLFLFFVFQIEHFVDPKDKKHPKFATIADKELVLFGQVR